MSMTFERPRGLGQPRFYADGPVGLDLAAPHTLERLYWQMYQGWRQGWASLCRSGKEPVPAARYPYADRILIDVFRCAKRGCPERVVMPSRLDTREKCLRLRHRGWRAESDGWRCVEHVGGR